MSQGPSLAGRAALAIVLTIGFYAMAVGIAFGLLWLVYAQVAYAERISVKLTVVAVFGAGAILWSVLPRWDSFTPPGPKLDKRAQPRLFRAIEDIARKTGQAPPAEVYMVSDVNAFVAQRGGIMGFGSKRIMGLGLPLMQVLTKREFEAVLAHEFGHFHGGDTRLGPFIYKTRFAIERTISNLAGAGSLLHLPFLWYGKLFLRLTLAISRAQEYAADALAARTVGAAALAGGLKKLPGASIAFGPYFDQEMVPALEAGVRPPLSGGFARFIESDGIAPVMEKVTNEALTSDEDDPYDTHPRLPARLAALQGQPDGTPCDGPRPSPCSTTCRAWSARCSRASRRTRPSSTSSRTSAGRMRGRGSSCRPGPRACSAAGRGCAGARRRTSRRTRRASRPSAGRCSARRSSSG